MSPKWGWIALGLAALTVASAAGIGRAAILNVAFPILSLICAVLLLRQPGAFVTFVLGVWIWAPFVRRIADWQSNYNPLSPVLVAPVLAMSVSVLAPKTVFAGLRALPGYGLLFVALGAGLLVGLAHNSPASAVYGALTWTAPLLFAAYVAGARNAAGQLEGQLLSSVALLAFLAALYENLPVPCPANVGPDPG